MVFDLRCLLPDTGKPITWTKNGEPLQNDPTNRRTFRNGLWTIRFNPLRSSDAGYYTCRYADGSMSYSTAIRVIGGSGSGTLSISQLKTLINYSWEPHIYCIPTFMREREMLARTFANMLLPRTRHNLHLVCTCKSLNELHLKLRILVAAKLCREAVRVAE